MTLLTPDDVAEQFQVDRRKVIEWTRRYGWPHVKVGRTIAFTEAQFEQIVALHSVDGTREHSSDRMSGQTHLSWLASQRRQSAASPQDRRKQSTIAIGRES